MALQLLIIDCSDPYMWYAGMIGKRVPFLYEDSNHYWSREPAGYSNIVRKKDAEIIEVSEHEEAN